MINSSPPQGERSGEGVVFGKGACIAEVLEGRADKIPDNMAMPIEKDTEEGAMAIDQFNDIIQNRPGSILLVDVRDKDEYDQGHFKTAVNIPVDEPEKMVKNPVRGQTHCF